MATRFYLPSSGTPPLSSLAVNTNWELTNGLVRLPCFITKQNTALATTQMTWPATITQQWCWWQFQSGTLAAAYDWTVSEVVSMVIGKCAETTTGGDSHLAYVVRVVSGDGSVIRGNIGFYHSTSTEFPLMASAATRIHQRTSGATAFSSQIGDRIIIEIGLHGVTPLAQLIQIRIGDPNATGDFAITEGLTTDLCPWVELVKNVTFGAAGYTLSAEVGSFALTGQVVVLKKISKIIIEAGTYALTGQVAGLSRGYRVIASSASYAETGQVVGLRKASKVGAASASFTLTGQAVTLKLDRKIAINIGSYILTGSGVTLTYTPAGKKIDAESGSFVLTGQIANLELGRKVIATAGSYTETGQIASLLKGFKIAVDPGSFVWTGFDVTLTEGVAAKILNAETAPFVLIGYWAKVRYKLATHHIKEDGIPVDYTEDSVVTTTSTKEGGISTGYTGIDKPSTTYTKKEKVAVAYNIEGER